jgi:hypothetical protein
MDEITTSSPAFAKHPVVRSGGEFKKCPHCDKDVINIRKKFCSGSCKYWYNNIKKDNEKHLPLKKFRNRQYFSMVVGSTNKSKGQGKRCGHMVTGGMSAMISSTVEEMVLVNAENIKRHMKGIPGFYPCGIKLGNGDWVKEENFEKELGIKL